MKHAYYATPKVMTNATHVSCQAVLIRRSNQSTSPHFNHPFYSEKKKELANHSSLAQEYTYTRSYYRIAKPATQLAQSAGALHAGSDAVHADRVRMSGCSGSAPSAPPPWTSNIQNRSRLRELDERGVVGEGRGGTRRRRQCT